MEIKIEVGEEKFKNILEKELEAFTQEELHEICRKALIQQMSDPAIFQDLFIDKSEGYHYNRYDARDVLKDAAKTIDFDETFRELQDGIVNYIKENHMKILHQVAINMFLDGLSRNIFNNAEFRNNLSASLAYHDSMVISDLKNNNC